MRLDKNKVKELLLNDIDSKEIAIVLNAKESAVRKCISRYFLDIVEKLRKEKEDKIAKLYKEGYTAEKIAYKLNMEISTVKNYFSLDRFIELKSTHEFNLKEIKKISRDTKRIMNQENNHILSTRGIINQNRQSFITRNGKLVFDNSRGARPWDVPQTYRFNV